MQSASPLIVVLGPTAIGKTIFAAQIAHLVNGEIISADSRQVYKHMNIGTGKDYDAYVVNGIPVPFHLIDIVEPTERYDVHRFMKDCEDAIEQVTAKNCIPIMCGGSGLYIQAVLKNYQYTAVPINHNLRAEIGDKPLVELQSFFNQLPENAYKVIADLSTIKRCIRAIEIAVWLEQHTLPKPESIKRKTLVLGLKNSVEERRKNIATRLKQRIENGLIDEVQLLMEKGLSQDQLIYFGLEYKYITYYLMGRINKDELMMQLTTAIQQFAKRQMTYFRKIEREGCEIIWVDASLPEDEKLYTFTQHYQYFIQNLA